nr:MAG TPA: hypothetical protein [Caudoviricetes sp.]
MGATAYRYSARVVGVGAAGLCPRRGVLHV